MIKPNSSFQYPSIIMIEQLDEKGRQMMKTKNKILIFLLIDNKLISINNTLFLLIINSLLQSIPFIKLMQSNSDSSYEQEYNIHQQLNQTANSIHNEYISEQNREMYELNPMLQLFVREQLSEVATLKFDDLQENSIFNDYQIKFIQPIPKVYFLPYQIIFLNKKHKNQQQKYQTPKIQHIKHKLETLIEKEKRQYIVSKDPYQSQSLNVKLHNKAQLIYYNLRTLKIDKKYHKNVQLLDSIHLIDKLFLYYKTYYKKLYFEQTATYLLYWAYQKELYNYQLTEHTLKLIIICIFINFGYGVTNIIKEYTLNPEKIKQNKKMNKLTHINNFGQTEINQYLIQNYKNYTILEKRGFYIVSKKKFLLIKDVIPINFPILPLSEQEDKRETEKINKDIEAVMKNGKQKMSICNNIFKIFKFLNKKFQKRIKLVIDFQIGLAYNEQYSENFQLEIFHPVLATSMCKIQGHSIRKIKSEIKSIYEQFTSFISIRDIIKDMLSKRK